MQQIKIPRITCGKDDLIPFWEVIDQLTDPAASVFIHIGKRAIKSDHSASIRLEKIISVYRRSNSLPSFISSTAVQYYSLCTFYKSFSIILGRRIAAYMSTQIGTNISCFSHKSEQTCSMSLWQFKRWPSHQVSDPYCSASKFTPLMHFKSIKSNHFSGKKMKRDNAVQRDQSQWRRCSITSLGICILADLFDAYRSTVEIYHFINVFHCSGRA